MRAVHNRRVYAPKIFIELFFRCILHVDLDLAQETESNTLVLKTTSRNFKVAWRLPAARSEAMVVLKSTVTYSTSAVTKDPSHYISIRQQVPLSQIKVWNGKEEPLTIEVPACRA